MKKKVIHASLYYGQSESYRWNMQQPCSTKNSNLSVASSWSTFYMFSIENTQRRNNLYNFLLKYFILYLFLFRFFTYTGRWKVTSFHNIFSGNTNLHERNLPSYLGSTYLSLSIPPEGMISRFFCFQGV